ncbi:MAG: mechanosensitive ion channel [Chloroflexi bacterium]|nr:mechanosensitive ion channel [Chloroflexota bacterium]
MLAQLLGQEINWPQVGARGFAIALTWVVVWFLVRHLGRWLDRLAERVRPQAIERRDLRSLDAALDALLITAGVIITLAILELTPLLMSLLTAAGFIGVITGLAIKDVASNLVSGVLLLMDRPFTLGDVVAAGGVQGTVEHITLRSTRIRTLDGPVVTVPNSIIAANAITNFTVNPLRRFEIMLSLPRDADPQAATQLLLDLAAAEPRLAAEPAPQVLIGDIRDFSMELRLICRAPNSVWLQVQSDMKRALLDRARPQSLKQTMPTQIVYTSPLTDKGERHG